MHAFAQAAFFKEVAFEAGGLAVEQVICLMNQTDEDVGDYLGGGVSMKGRKSSKSVSRRAPSRRV